MKHLALIIVLSFATAAHTADEYFDKTQFEYIIHLLESNPEETIALERITRKGDQLFCSGESPAAVANNKAAALVREGKYDEAIQFLEECLKRAPLFFPFRFNLGVAYYHVRNFPKSFLNLKKCEYLVPEYYIVYVQLGYLNELMAQYDNALINYKTAMRLNPKDLDNMVMIGNLYYNRKQLERALDFYSAALRQNRQFPNALLGEAKIYFARKRYYQSYQTLKKIDVSGEYDKAYHYYYAECAYKLTRYREAYQNYQEMLKYKNDKFFLHTSISLVEHKTDLAKRFAESEEESAP